MDDLIELKGHHVDADYVRAAYASGTTPPSIAQLLLYSSMHIDSSYLASLARLGYHDQSEIQSLSSAHITADLIKGFQDAGLKNIPVITLLWMKSNNVSPEMIRKYRSAGFTDLDLPNLSVLKNAGITPEFVDSFRKIGYDDIPLPLLYQLKASGVDADYVTRMKAKGLNSTDLEKYIRLKQEFN